MKNWTEITEKAMEICQRAREEVILPLQQKGLQVSEKDKTGRNFVTEADKACEGFLKTELKKLVPEAGFIAEESFEGKIERGLNWIIDPIDGTTNFMHGCPPYCISVALTDGEEILVGVILELFSGEMFHATKGHGAFLNGSRVHVSKTNALSASFLATGFPYDYSGRFDRWMEIFAEMVRKASGVRRPGAAAIDMAYVACGRFDGFVEYNLQPWDVAAGALLVTEAGGKVSGFVSDEYLFSGRLLCSNGHIHAEMQDLLKDFDSH